TSSVEGRRRIAKTWVPSAHTTPPPYTALHCISIVLNLCWYWYTVNIVSQPYHCICQSIICTHQASPLASKYSRQFAAPVAVQQAIFQRYAYLASPQLISHKP